MIFAPFPELLPDSAHLSTYPTSASFSLSNENPNKLTKQTKKLVRQKVLKQDKGFLALSI